MMKQANELAVEALVRDLRERHRPILEWLQANDFSCLLTVREESITYLTGYTTMTWKSHSRPIAVVLTVDGRLMMIAAATEVDAVRLRVPGVEARSYVVLEPVSDSALLPDGHVQFSPSAARLLAEIIDEAGPGRIGVDGLMAAWPPIASVTDLLPHISDRLEDASQIVWQGRLRKTTWEVERLRKAADVLAEAYQIVEQQIRPGMSEIEIARIFSIAQLQAGADEVGPLGVVAGPHRGLFGFPTEKVWTAEDLLYIDGAAMIGGYFSDFCRTYAARPPTANEATGYARAREGLLAALQTEPLGTTTGELGRIMADAMNVDPSGVGFGRFGHGLGLQVPEPPSLHPSDPTSLQPGMVLCIEPTVVHNGVNYVVEEEYLVTESGLELFSVPALSRILHL